MKLNVITTTIYFLINFIILCPWFGADRQL